MSFTYTPGLVLVDEVSTFGAHAHLPSSEAAQWPADDPWLAQLRVWLDRIAGASVGRVLLETLQRRPARSGVVVSIVRSPRTVPEAYTDGIIAAHQPGNPSASPTVFVTFTPADARRAPIDLSPMRHPGSILAHELMHALMGVWGLNALTTSTGARRPVASWTSAAYPNHNEFCATTVQNMLLSEMGVRLSDGYHDGDPAGDDPTITTTVDPALTRTDFGLRARSSVDLAAYVRTYRQPLDFMVAELPTFCGRLAALTGVAFNPFAHMRSSPARVSPPTSGGRGAARVPGPIDISPH